MLDSIFCRNVCFATCASLLRAVANKTELICNKKWFTLVRARSRPLKVKKETCGAGVLLIRT